MVSSRSSSLAWPLRVSWRRRRSATRVWRRSSVRRCGSPGSGAPRRPSSPSGSCRAADADAGRVLAAVPVRGAPPVPIQRPPPSWRSSARRASRGTPHQLVARQALELRALLVGELAEVLRVRSHSRALGDVVERALDALEDPRERPVEGVEVRLALDRQARRQVVEALQARAVQALLERLSSSSHSWMPTGTPSSRSS
jgi:hypothetical protein